MYLIGYDIGSSSIKAALINAATNETVDVIKYPETEFDMISRQYGWAEQYPDVWWQNLAWATRKLLSQNNVHKRDVKGIGLAYQMHGLVLVDENHQVLRPSIIWCDSRAVSIGDKAFHALGQEYCMSNLLNSPGNFTASKLKWVKDNEPETYHRIHKVLLPGDFIALRLTGEANTTIPGLSEGIFWDFKEHKISEKVLDYFEIDRSLIPDITPTFGHQGKVTREAAEMTGLAIGTPVTYRGGDQPNNALAVNVLNPGEIAATSGTSGVVYGIMDKPLSDAKGRINSFAHINHDIGHERVGVLLCLNGAGIQYSWIKNQIARTGRSYDDMERMVSTVPVGSDGLCVLPFGNGAERMIHNKNINAHVFNIQFNRHHRAHLYRAGLEGVAFSFVYGMEILKELGMKVDVMRVGNDNMFQSEVFASTIATLMGCHIEVMDTTGAVGAARAAGVANGVYSSLEEALKGIKSHAVHEPKLSYGLCNQAYSYWVSCLEKMLSDKPQLADMSDKLSQRVDSLEAELNEKNKALTTFSHASQSKDDLLKEVLSDLESLESKVGKQAVGDVKRVIKKISGKLSTEAQSPFEEHLELVHSDIFKKLKQKIPEISMSEVRLSALIKMGLTTKDIAEQLSLSVRGVETQRYRLRKKLNLDKVVSLEDFLDKV